MKRMKFRYLLFLILPIVLASCEKNIDFNLDSVPPVLVVDASIENGQPPIVVLSSSFSFFAQLSPQLLEASFVHNADVYIYNGTFTHKLREYHIDTTGGFKAYFYTIDTANLGTAFLGELNKRYDLKIEYNGIEYTSSTTIPSLAKKPDSLWWKPAPLNPDTNKVVVMVKTTDPPGLGNYVRYFTKRNSDPYLPGAQSVFDDQVIDGTTYEIQVYPGVDRNDMPSDEDNFFFKGDTVTLKISNIDRSTYQFWNTMEFNYQSVGNPFASPNKVIGNISNGALGAFCGYGSSTKTVIIPR
jgi:hypothetical protein